METIEYRGFEIEIEQDTTPANPWTEFDGEPPLVALGPRGHHEEHGLDLNPPTLTREQIKKHAGDIRAELGDGQIYNPSTGKYEPLQGASLLSVLSAYVDRHQYGTDIEGYANECIAVRAAELNNSDKLDFLANVWQWSGAVAYSGTRNGHCQGDWIDVLVVATADWQERVGAPADSLKRQVETAADLYGQYAFGDVYGYTVDDGDVGSCWGFYGTDWEKSGLLEHARADIDSHLEEQRKAHQDKMKLLIANRVPLNVREIMARM